MAERRMLSKSVTCTDNFIGLPKQAQLLYVYLCLHADDDGFVGNPNTICSYVKIPKSHLTELINRRFIHCFTSGVAVILHWKLHNQISPSKKKATIYTEEARMLTVTDNKMYALRSEMSAEEQQNCCTGALQERCIGEDRVDQDRIGQVSSGEEKTDAATPSSHYSPPPPPTKKEVEDYARENGLMHVDIDRFFNYYSDSNWCATTGTPIHWQGKLRDWDITDRKYPNTHRTFSSPSAKEAQGSFDTDDFFEAALARAYSDAPFSN